MWAGPAQLTGPSSAQEEVGQRPKMVGPISAHNIFFFSFWAGLNPAQTLGLGQHWPGLYAMLIICRTWTVVHVLHATEMAAKMEVGGGEDYRERWSRIWSGGWADGFGGVTGVNGGRSRSRGKEKGFCRGEREEEAVTVSGVGWPACGWASYLWWRWWWGDRCEWWRWLKATMERERRERTAVKTGEQAGFFWFLDPNFSLLRTCNLLLFIGGGRGKSSLHEGKTFSPWFEWKNPDRPFKVCTSNCQIWQSKAARGGHFRPVVGAVLMFIGLNG